MTGESSGRVRELRLVITVDDFDAALGFYRDALGLPEVDLPPSQDGRVAVLDAGRATLELADDRHSAWVDEIEVGRRVSGRVRVAFGVDDSAGVGRRLATHGARAIGDPVATPWGSVNVRLDGPEGLQLTLFTDPVKPP